MAKSKYYKFTSAEQVAKTLERLIPGKIEAVRGSMDIHGGGYTRVWVSEFDEREFSNNSDQDDVGALTNAINYIASNINGPKKFAIDGIYIDIERDTSNGVKRQYQTADQAGESNTIKTVVQTLVALDDYSWEETKSVIENIPEKFLTSQVLEKVIKEKYKKDDLPRNIIALFPTNSFTPKIKKLLLTTDPDTIFYFPDGSASPQDVLYSIDMALKQGGFTSPAGDSEEDLPSNLPKGSIDNDVVQALKTKLNVPDEAFSEDYFDPSELERIKSLSGIK